MIEAGTRPRREAERPTKKRPYEAPLLQCFGNVRDITLGASQGFGESTGAGVRKGGPGS